MDSILNIRQNIINLYKRYDIAINYILKFIIGLVIFSRVNNIGLYHEQFDILFGSATQHIYLILLSLIFTILPHTLSLFLITLAITIQLSAVIEVAFFVFLILSLIIIFYARLSPRQSMLIIALIFGFYFRIPYAVVLYAGLYFGVLSIVPITIGVAIWHFMPFFGSLAQTTPIQAEFDIFEAPIAFLDVFGEIFSVLTNDFNWIIIAFVFAMMILAVHLISMVAMNYAKDIAVIVGSFIGMLCMIMVTVVANLGISIFGIIFSSIFSAATVWIIKFFDKVLDYKRVERVQFEDEDNYYYVKIIPKIKLVEQPIKAPIEPIPKARTERTAPYVAKEPPLKQKRDAEEKPQNYSYRSKLYNQELFDDEL